MLKYCIEQSQIDFFTTVPLSGFHANMYCEFLRQASHVAEVSFQQRTPLGILGLNINGLRPRFNLIKISLANTFQFKNQ